MINMIKADFYRIFRGIGIYIALAVILVMIALDIYSAEAGSIGVHVESQVEIDNELSGMTYEEINDLSMGDYREIRLKSENYQLDRDILATNANLYYAFIFAAAIAVTVDFSGSSIKNTLSSAINRRNYFLSKLVVIALCCLLLCVLNTYIMYFANIIFNSRNLASDIGTVTKITLVQLPPVLAFVSILTGFAFALKRTAVFNAVTIPFLILVQLLESLLSAIFKIPNKVFDFELQTMIAKLAYEPSGEYILKSYIVCTVIIIAFNLMGWMAFKKAEIR